MDPEKIEQENTPEDRENLGPEDEKPEKAGQEALEEWRKMEERRIKRVCDFDFTISEIDYSSDEQKKIAILQEKFQKLLVQTEDDPQKFLGEIKKQDVDVVENSVFLKNKTQTMEGVISRALGTPKGIMAGYLNPERIQKLLQSEKVGSAVYEELANLKGKNGAIFLYKKPDAKSIFHEGLHALQYIESFDMQQPDEPESRSRRELETNWALVKTKEDGLLSKVDRLNSVRTAEGHFGPKPIYGTNDIVQEVRQFEDNLQNLKDEVGKRKAREEIKSSLPGP